MNKEKAIKVMTEILNKALDSEKFSDLDYIKFSITGKKRDKRKSAVHLAFTIDMMPDDKKGGK